MTAATELASAALAGTSRSTVIVDATLPDHPIVYANAAFAALSGYSVSEVIGRNSRFMQGPDTDPRTRSEMREAIAAGCSIQRDILNYRKDGSTFLSAVTIDPIRNDAGLITHYVGMQHPINDVLEAAPGASAESRLASIAHNIPGYVYHRVLRADGRIELLYISPSLRRLLGLDDHVAATAFYDHVHPDDRDGLSTAIRKSAANLSLFREEFRLIAADGSTHWMRSDAPPRRSTNGETLWDGVAIEISAETRWDSEIAKQALRDPLTGLLTRAAWRNALALQCAASASGNDRCAVIYIDIADFAALNQRLGQARADDVLRGIARRVADVTETHSGSAARLGGDEFAVLIPACDSDEALVAIARSIDSALTAPFEIGGRQEIIAGYIGGAMGVPPSPDDGAEQDAADELTTQAELALRWAKQAGPSRPTLYCRERDDRFQNQGLLARSLKAAIENNELDLHYQPLVDLASGRIVSAEALVRWRHPTLGIQRPDLFIPLAEEMGLIGPLGHWVLKRAMRQSRSWRDEGIVLPPIAINVSGNQLLDPEFVGLVEDALNTSGAEAGDFEFELTEGVLIEASPQIMASLSALKAMGFTLTIDDFGSGHATFRYLREFPVDKLKIDQIFVRQLVLESTDALIIRAIISLARSMGVAFVAEGIETEMQRDFLQREGCEIGQGYLFSMPLLSEDYAWMLANDLHLPLGRSIGTTTPPRETTLGRATA